jgi:Predicted transcriptional regulators
VIILKLKKLKDLREDHDYTQAEVAKMVNITQRSYSHYENGERSIPLEVLGRLADLYNVSVDYIMDRETK